jgi:hypothetical protein
MVKEQNLALNPTKISGICGRLMCCMSYEHSNYSELWKSLPNPGSKIKTAQGTYTLEGVDLRTQSVRVRFPEGREVSVAVSEFENFKDTISRGEPWETELPQNTSRRSPFLLRPSFPPRTAAVSKISRLAPGESKAENPKDFLKNNKKLKPEKITLEKHIAARVSDMKQNPAGASAMNVAVNAAMDAEAAKKRLLKHKGAPGESSPARAPIRANPAAKDVKRGAKAKPVPPRKDRVRPAEARLSEARPAEVRSGSFGSTQKDPAPQKDPRKDARDNRGRTQPPPRRGGGEERGHERQRGEKRGSAGNAEGS